MAVERDRQAIHGLGRGAATAHRLHELATELVIVGAPSASAYLAVLGEGTQPE